MLKVVGLLISLLISSSAYSQVFRCSGRTNSYYYNMTSNMVPLLGNIRCAPIRYEASNSTLFLDGIICQTEHTLSLYYPNDDAWFCNKYNSAGQIQWRCQGVGKYNANANALFRCRWSEQ